MLCTLTARRLRPGHYDAFRAAFREMNDGAPADIVKRWTNVYITRDVQDEDVVISFGLFDGTIEELREIQSSGGSEAARTSGFAGFSKRCSSTAPTKSSITSRTRTLRGTAGSAP